MENSRRVVCRRVCFNNFEKDYICVEHIHGNIDKLSINVNEEIREKRRRE